MGQRFAGRVAVVTGASSGIGAAIAAALAAEGAAVVGFARRFSAAASSATCAPGRVSEVHLDVTDEAAVDAGFAAVTERGGLDILVVSAGNFITAPIAEARAQDLRAMLEVHVVGAFLCARAALRHMAPRRRGHIVNVSSIAALKTFPGAAGYSAAKEAQRGLTRVLVEEARAHDVRVTGLYPGATDTPLWADAPFDRAKMMTPAALAGLVSDVLARPELSVEEIVVLPPAGVL
jgi:NAD(P)-dependent dehydrogenase (short-subunit alcohol dehydrogenase family)